MNVVHNILNEVSGSRFSEYTHVFPVPLSLSLSLFDEVVYIGWLCNKEFGREVPGLIRDKAQRPHEEAPVRVSS